MIYAYEHITDFDKKLLKALEPFVEFNYSIEDSKNMLNWTVHRRVKDKKEYEIIRTYRLEELRQGFIATDVIDAKKLSYYLKNQTFYTELEREYNWLSEYVSTQPKAELLTHIALPISTYIKEYSDDFEMLSKIDFNQLFKKD